MKEETNKQISKIELASNEVENLLSKASKGSQRKALGKVLGATAQADVAVDVAQIVSCVHIICHYWRASVNHNRFQFRSRFQFPFRFRLRFQFISRAKKRSKVCVWQVGKWMAVKHS